MPQTSQKTRNLRYKLSRRILAFTPRGGAFGRIPELSRPVKIVDEKAKMRAFEFREAKPKSLLRLSIT